MYFHANLNLNLNLNPNLKLNLSHRSFLPEAHPSPAEFTVQ